MAVNAASNIAQKYMGDKPTATTNDPDVRPGQTQRACIWRGARKLEMQDIPIPAVTEPKDAVIRITGSTVCGSDLHLYHGEIMQLKDGDPLGHEFMGIVEEVGSGVTSVKKGDRVVASFSIACGDCRYCKEGNTTSCDRTNSSTVQEKLYGTTGSSIFGYSHFVGGFAGGQAEYARIPFADVNLLSIPDNVPDEKALYLSDIICTSYHCVLDSGCQEGETIGVWGLGPIGLLICQWLKNVFKAKRIIAVDNVKDRLDLVKRLYGVETVNFDEHKDVSEHIQTLVPGGLDRCLDAAGFRYGRSLIHKAQRAVGLETDTPEIINECVRSVRKLGTIGLIADYVGTTNGLLIGAIMMKGVRLIGNGQAPVQKYWKKILGYLQDGTFDPTLILTHRFRLEQTPEVYERFDKKDLGIMKCFIETRHSLPRAEGTPVLTEDINAL